jgi:probable F420-dependent oxidoreductase
MNLAGVGVWNVSLRYGDRSEAADAAAELEELGYSAIWVPGAGADLTGLEWLLSSTNSMTVATGILSIWTHPPDEVAEVHRTFTDQHGDRFLVGLGVSHQDIVDQQEPGRYRKPLAAMRSFLDGLDTASPPLAQDRRVLAALGPQMLRLARDRTAGAHPYNVTPEHTAEARAALGPGKLLAPEQAVVLCDDPTAARGMARSFLDHYLVRTNYANNLRRLGFTDEDFADGGSNRLVDALVAWGDEDSIARRIKDHIDAGADHVCIQAIDEAGMMSLPRQVWRRLAPVLNTTD